MQKMRSFTVLLGIILLVSIGSCSKFRKLQKSEDWRVKYDAALEYYDDEDYYRASLLFEEIMPLVRGQEEGEVAQIKYAYCNYNQKQYQLASYYFKTFYQTYSRSEFALEAEYMHAYSLYRDSPLYNLDQTSTKEAIDAMQSFLNRNPDSEYLAQSTAIITELQVKLETKSYENAKQYHKMGLHRSAIVAFKNFAIDFPDSEFNEELSFLTFDSKYQLAILSIRSKQEERYMEAIEIYQEFLEDYPESEYLKEAGRMYEDSINEIGKIRSDKSINN
jgi:outer membrane protein assembly factor BamD